jgi:murein DD-endopeptidase MepM/ murein hydrolase activator NlpD
VTKIYSVYLYVDSSVKSGESVDTETVVGTVHNWPNNSHLHWEIRKYASMKDAPIPAACKKSGVVGPSYTDTGTTPDAFGYINPSGWVQEN